MSYLSYTLFEYKDDSSRYLNFFQIISTSYYRKNKDEHCRTIKCGTYEELLHYCAENHIEF